MESSMSEDRVTREFQQAKAAYQKIIDEAGLAYRMVHKADGPLGKLMGEENLADMVATYGDVVDEDVADADEAAAMLLRKRL